MDATRNLLAAAASLLAAPVLAQGLTVVNDPWPGEQSHAQMLAGVFGGSFDSMGQVSGLNTATGGSGTVDIGFSNGNISAMRVSDLGSGTPADLRGLSASMNDQAFGAGSYAARVIGHNSALDHEFGVVRNDGTFRSLLTSSDTGEVAIHPGQNFTWAVRTSNGLEISSDNALNGGADHMVTYVLYNNTNNKVIGAVLFFEDWMGQNGDYDYNDLGIILTLAPTPNAALLGLAGLGGVGLATGRRRR
ncbi:MAG: hypothetical protein ACTS22_00765 [Phycisphaerales bacterium]